MKVLQINNHFENVGGAESVFINTIKLLEENGHSVLTLSRSHDTESKKKTNSFLIEYKNSFSSKFYSKEAIKCLEEILNYEKPAIAHVHNLVGGITFSVLSALKKNKIPIVMTVHDFRLICPAAIFLDGKGQVCEKCEGKNYFKCVINNCSPDGLFRSISIALESYLRDLFFPYSDYIDQYIFVSDFAKNMFLKYNPQIEKRSNVIYNFTETFNSQINRGNYYLFFGRLAREKGLKSLLNVFRSLPEIKLKIVGDGPLKEEIINLKSDNVEYLGYQKGKELEYIVSNSHFVITPSETYETLSMTTAEALSMSKPVIVSNIGALSEIVNDEVDGYIFKYGNEEELKKCILTSSQLSDARYKDMSINAYRNSKNRFYKEKYYKKLTEVYSKMIK